MVYMISIIMVIILYLCIYWLYQEYKKKLNERDKLIEKCFKKIERLERKNMINEKLLKWLYDELTRKNLLSIEKGNK